MTATVILWAVIVGLVVCIGSTAVVVGCCLTADDMESPEECETMIDDMGPGGAVVVIRCGHHNSDTAATHIETIIHLDGTTSPINSINLLCQANSICRQCRQDAIGMVKKFHTYTEN